MNQNSKITNVQADNCSVKIDVLATTGVNSCIAVAAIFNDTREIFIGHYSTNNVTDFGTVVTFRGAWDFIEKITDDIFRESLSSSLETIFLIGGWDVENYLQLHNIVENIHIDEKWLCSQAMSSNISKLISCVKYVHLHFNLEHRDFNNRKVI
jgi:hypothetical protein